jgi:hypothetical protein
MAFFEENKQRVILKHFKDFLGSYVPRSCTLNLNNLGWAARPLQHLKVPISKEELQKIIKDSPKEKAHGPDGFIGLFFSYCWNIIKHDLLLAVEHFMNMNQQGLRLLNQAYIVLIPKKDCHIKVSDYRPISLIHSFAKFVSKILASRLALELKYLVSMNQTTFIKDRCIHGNFAYVQGVIKHLHKKHTPALFIKLDISKLFDIVN